VVDLAVRWRPVPCGQVAPQRDGRVPARLATAAVGEPSSGVAAVVGGCQSQSSSSQGSSSSRPGHTVCVPGRHRCRRPVGGRRPPKSLHHDVRREANRVLEHERLSRQECGAPPTATSSAQRGGGAPLRRCGPPIVTTSRRRSPGCPRRRGPIVSSPACPDCRP